MSRRIAISGFGVVALTIGLFVQLSSDDPSNYLVFCTWGTGTEIESFQKIIDRYNATHHPLHKVKLAHGEQTQYTERLLVQAAARSMPDVIHLDRKDIPLMVQKGLLTDLTPQVRQDTAFRLDAFLPELVPGGMIEGEIYGIPHNFSTLVLYYNRDHFDAEGIPYPDSTWTWESLLSAARRLTKRNASGETVRYGCLMRIVLSTMIIQNGGRILNDALDSCVIASPEAAGALQFDINLSEKYRVSWSQLSQNLQWDDMFAGGRLSMIANGRWAAGWYMRSMSPRAVDVAPLPRGRFRRGAAVNHLMTISSQTRKKEEAWAFLKYLVSEEAERMVNREGANIPALRSIAYSDQFLHHPATPTMHNRVFLEELAYSIPWPYEQGPYLSLYTLQSQMDLAMRRVLLGRQTALQSLKLMQDNVNAVIAAARGVPQPSRFIGSVLFYLCCAASAAVAAAGWVYRKKGRSDEQ